jgi:1-hydroxycarotenoid 3,4-desaturase
VAAALGTRAARVLSALGARPTLAGALGAQFSDPRLAQLFSRYATYVGGSPWLSPAVLMLIWRAEAAGVWHVDGGMAAIARAIADLAEARGAAIRTATPVTRIVVEQGHVAGVQLDDGERIAADSVLFNGDPSALSAGLLGPSVAGAAPRLERSRRSLSAWVWTFAGAPEGVDLEAHTVFFSADYRAEFDDLFGARRLPRDPTVYVHAQDRTAGPAPPSPERLMMIMNAPADGDRGAPTEEEIEACGTRVFGRLATSGLRLERPGPEAITTPAEFARLFPGTGGAIYGTAPHGMMATFRRPMTRTKVAGLYLAGGGAHPGPGVAMSCLSGRLAAAAIREDLGST